MTALWPVSRWQNCLPKHFYRREGGRTWFLVKSLSQGSGGKKKQRKQKFEDPPHPLQWPPGWRPPEPQPNSHPPVLSFLPGWLDPTGGQLWPSRRPGRRPGARRPAAADAVASFSRPQPLTSDRFAQKPRRQNGVFQKPPRGVAAGPGRTPHAGLIQSLTVLSARAPPPRLSHHVPAALQGLRRQVMQWRWASRIAPVQGLGR